jgi:hypothetical protein
VRENQNILLWRVMETSSICMMETFNRSQSLSAKDADLLVADFYLFKLEIDVITYRI